MTMAPAKQRLLGLDVGNKRIGTAFAEPGMAISVPFKTFERKGGKAESAILALIKERKIELLVAGLPLNDDNSRNEQCQVVENFCRRLEKRANIKTVYVDEYATSFEAEEKLVGAGITLKSAKNKGSIDALSAAIILQLYLDNL